MRSLFDRAVRILRKEGWSTALRKAGSFSVHQLSSFFYPASYFLSYPLTTALRAQNKSFLHEFIKGRKVLILGSGPSVSELRDIPNDVLVFTCNRGLKFFAEKPTSRPLDLYICTAGKIQRMPIIKSLLKKMKTRFLVIDDIRYIRRNREFSDVYDRLVQDDGKHNHYLKRLIKPSGIKNIRGSSFHPWTSTGIRLLQYALHHEAAEIYLAGIDFGDNGYFWGRNEDKWLHDEIDENFLSLVSKKYKNVYSVSKDSRLSRYVPHKNFEMSTAGTRSKDLLNQWVE